MCFRYRLLSLLAIFCLILNACGQSRNKEDITSSPAGSEPSLPVMLPSSAPSASASLPGEDDIETDIVQKLLDGMSLKEKVYQLFIICPEALDSSSPVTEIDDEFIASLQDNPVGGLVFFSDNIVSSDQLLQMTQKLNGSTSIGLFLAVDEEGGDVSRLTPATDAETFEPMYSYRDKGPSTAYKNAAAIGKSLMDHGLNLNFAPVADVWSNPDNSVIGTRAYSSSYHQASALVASAVRGFHESGIACTLKHFPGHGDTFEDSHNSLAEVTRSLSELLEGELLPFCSGIDAGTDMVMVGHLYVPALDSEFPAPISSRIISELLRSELGYDGIVITDSLLMGAAEEYSSEELAVKCISAGVDILLMPEDLNASAQALSDAVVSGELTLERIDESVLRILRLKERLGLLG